MAAEAINNNTSLELREEENASKIDCSNLAYVEKVCDVVSEKFNSMAGCYDMTEEQKKEFQMRFAQEFKNAIFENITIKGLPWEVYRDTSMSTLNKEEKRHFINQKILPQLGREMVRTTEKRKNYPIQCCRVLQLRLKHERQMLKKQKVNATRCPALQETIDKACQNSSEKLSSSFAKIEEFALQQKAYHLEVLKQIELVKKVKADAANAEKICSNQTEFCPDTVQISSMFSLPKKDSIVPSVI